MQVTTLSRQCQQHEGADSAQIHVLYCLMLVVIPLVVDNGISAAKHSLGSHDLRFESKKLWTKVKPGGKMRQARESFVKSRVRAEKSNPWGI